MEASFQLRLYWPAGKRRRHLVTAAIRNMAYPKQPEAGWHRWRAVPRDAGGGPGCRGGGEPGWGDCPLNRSGEEAIRISRDELIGQTMTNIIPAGFAERLIADETRSAAEARLSVTKDGHNSFHASVFIL
jgi:hypothetical protein